MLTGGLPKLEELLDRAAATGGPVSGDDAFRLYDTFGLPLDFIEDLTSERKLTLDRAAFDAAMEAQRDKARAKSAFDGEEDRRSSRSAIPRLPTVCASRAIGSRATRRPP